jgi:hypothetical protein
LAMITQCDKWQSQDSGPSDQALVTSPCTPYTGRATNLGRHSHTIGFASYRHQHGKKRAHPSFYLAPSSLVTYHLAHSS